jgi:hypothetical protein
MTMSALHVRMDLRVDLLMRKIVLLWSPSRWARQYLHQ